MQSIEKSITRVPTKVLYIPHVPPLLASWNTLKTHFSQYGNVKSVVLHPQRRSCTVSFETVTDAEYAKSKGCVWKNKEFEAMYCKYDSILLDPRAKSGEVLGYSDLETLWSDEDMDEFGVAESKSPLQKLREREIRKKEKIPRKVNLKLTPEMHDELESQSVHVLKSKTISEKKIPKSPKLKTSSEKKSLLLKSSGERKPRSLITLFSVKEKQKEAKKKVKEALLERSKKRLSGSNQTKDIDAVVKTADTPSLTLKEKFNLLEERDKLIRKRIVKNSNVKTAKTVVGTCPDMCPEKERIMREYRRLVSIYEMVPGTQDMDHAIAVKAYVRSSADQEEPLPHELRPIPVLTMTMGYLITKIIPLIDDPEVNLEDWYDFCWDRLRGIRKDVIQQRLCNLETVTIIEQSARYHICCYDHFWGADPSIFDEKINTENLMNCLQILRHMYEDLGKEGIKCPNEGEFNAYMILLNMKTGYLMETYQLFSESLQKEERIQVAVKLYLAFNNFMYSQFFKLVKNSTYLDACLLQRYFYGVRVQALQAIARAYCPPNKGGTIPLKQMKNILKFDTAEDTALFCEGHGIMLKENKRDFSLYRNDFVFPDEKIKTPAPSSLVTRKRLPVVKVVTGGQPYYLHSFKHHSVHSSFTEGGKLNEMASDASDQKNKSSEMLSKLIDVEMNEELNDADEDMTESRSGSFFSFDDTFSDKADDDMEQQHEIKEEFAFPMDTDDNIATIQPEEDLCVPLETNSEIDLKKPESIDNDEYSNNNFVSKKQQSDSLGFKFDLTSVKMQPIKEPEQQPSTSFNFGSAAANIFGTRNQQISDQLKHNQFTLKLDFTQQSAEDNLSVVKDGLFNQNKNTSILKSHVESAEISDKSLDFNKTVSESVTTHGDNLNFTFSLSKKTDDLHSPKLSKKVTFIDQVAKPKSDNIQTSINVDYGRNYLDSLRSKEHSFQPDKENQSPISGKGTFNKNFTSMEHSFRKAATDKNRTTIDEKEKDSDKKISDYEEEKLNEIKKKKLEQDERVMKKLKKDLRRKLKTITARHFIRKWKQKIEKIKRNRIEFPLLISTPIEQHETVWGTVNAQSSTMSLLNRLKDKRQSIENVDLILNKGLRQSVKYLGNEIAENIILNNSSKLDLRDFSVPFYWKLVISIPFTEDSFFTKKFKDWLNKLFYNSEDSTLGSVREEITSQSVPVYYCAHVVCGNSFLTQKDKLTAMNGLIFFNICGIESSVDICKRFRSLISSNKSTKPVTVALVNIGKASDNSNQQLVNIMKAKVKNCKVKKWTEEYYSDFDSIGRVVKFLTTNVDLSNCIRVCTLNSLFDRISEHILNFLDSVKIVSSEFRSAIMNPNFVIDFYNTFFDELEKIIDSDLKDYDIVPPEFNNLVLHFNKPGEASPVNVSFNKTRRPNISKSFSRMKLPFLKPWPPRDALELLGILDSFCHSVGCKNILSRIFRAINLNDDVDISKNLNSVSWVSVIDLILRWLLETHKDNTRKIVVIYNENLISDLCHIDFNFKLLQNKLVNA